MFSKNDVEFKKSDFRIEKKELELFFFFNFYVFVKCDVFKWLKALQTVTSM